MDDLLAQARRDCSKSCIPASFAPVAELECLACRPFPTQPQTSRLSTATPSRGTSNRLLAAFGSGPDVTVLMSALVGRPAKRAISDQSSPPNRFTATWEGGRTEVKKDEHIVAALCGLSLQPQARSPCGDRAGNAVSHGDRERRAGYGDMRRPCLASAITLRRRRNQCPPSGRRRASRT
jgi:hypothetical protein